MVAYEKFNDGVMDDYIPTDEDLAAGLNSLPQVPGQE
jgi:tryptophan synthase beta chain